jgi:hypothetical protein
MRDGADRARGGSCWLYNGLARRARAARPPPVRLGSLHRLRRRQPCADRSACRSDRRAPEWIQNRGPLPWRRRRNLRQHSAGNGRKSRSLLDALSRRSSARGRPRPRLRLLHAHRRGGGTDRRRERHAGERAGSLVPGAMTTARATLRLVALAARRWRRCPPAAPEQARPALLVGERVAPKGVVSKRRRTNRYLEKHKVTRCQLRIRRHCQRRTQSPDANGG